MRRLLTRSLPLPFLSVDSILIRVGLLGVICGTIGERDWDNNLHSLVFETQIPW